MLNRKQGTVFVSFSHTISLYMNLVRSELLCSFAQISKFFMQTFLFIGQYVWLSLDSDVGIINALRRVNVNMFMLCALRCMFKYTQLIYCNILRLKFLWLSFSVELCLTWTFRLANSHSHSRKHSNSRHKWLVSNEHNSPLNLPSRVVLEWAIKQPIIAKCKYLVSFVDANIATLSMLSGASIAFVKLIDKHGWRSFEEKNNGVFCLSSKTLLMLHKRNG